MGIFDRSKHPRGGGGRFKNRFRTEPAGELEADQWVSAPTVSRGGIVQWRTRDGILHRLNGPALTHPNGSQYWFQYGKQHRTDGPAITRGNNSKSWYQHGERHREDAPAVDWVDGYQEWYLHGKRHRIDGPAVILTDGTFEWWENDVRKPPEVEAALTMIWLARTP